MLKPDTLALTIVLALLTALGPLSTDMYLPSLPAIATGLEASTGQTQLTLSAFLLGFAAGQFFYGPVSDRIGRKPVLLFGLGLFTVASLICALSPNIETLIGARFLQALGASGPIVLGRAIVRDFYEGPRAGRELSRMGTIMGVVPAAAPVLGGVIERFSGWRVTFGVMILFGIALAATILWRMPESIRRKSDVPISFPSILRGFRLLLGHAGYRTYVGLSMLTYGGLFAFISGSSFVLQKIYRLDELSFAFSFTFVVVGFMTGTTLAQRLVGRYGLDGTIRIGVTCLALGGVTMLALVLAGVPSSLSISAPMALYGVGVGLTMPQSMASALMPFPDRAGAASSLLGICQMTFAAIVGILLGRNLDASAVPLPATIAMTGVLALALFLATGRARGDQPKG
ncbi:multidrug effflux MFS transporter [Microvirga lotononidis]|uniref:Bcr/CflA family efflux transporter n=1 Tax=Microvirga lotononidis TaxID=864069 RepID=I4YZB8_9HYPH|nr:multidrug effflux MFS transporter [Microvirga lotononidis]EIM29310.1 drug resistance transporter, Bcr/CflA subfamily [Microvirga lotononidis]WQO29136.1 multidrug effflux MFS transporter [Microvirga lotononidis]